MPTAIITMHSSSHSKTGIDHKCPKATSANPQIHMSHCRSSITLWLKSSSEILSSLHSVGSLFFTYQTASFQHIETLYVLRTNKPLDLDLHNNEVGEVPLSPSYRGINWGSERLSDLPRFTQLAGACLLRSKLRSVESTAYALSMAACHTRDSPKITKLLSRVRKIETRGRSRPEEGSSRNRWRR